VARRTRSPQEKKQLSLERDRPLTAEYPKAFRKQWPRTKATAQRAFRHAQRQALDAGSEDATGVRRRVRKWPQPRLGDVVATKLQRRVRLEAIPRKSAVARHRRALRRRRAGAR